MRPYSHEVCVQLDLSADGGAQIVRIVVYCYPSTDYTWSPRSAETGIGGSEEAVIHMASALAMHGHDVAVLNARTGPPQAFGGVTWTSYNDPATLDADIGVVWRRPGLIERVGGIRARRLYLWLHDMVPEAWILPRLEAYFKVMVLSRFHRNHYPGIPEARVFRTANGIEPTEFSGSESRDPGLMVYGSCYTRGLRALLNNWRRIRGAAPGARLNIFYGWQTLQRNNPERYARIRPVLEPLMQQEGVTHLGCLSHAEVARQYSKAGVWAYPCSFPEPSCISAMKAQAGGATPAVIPSGALAETVRFGFRTMRSHTDFRGLPFPHRIIDEWLEGLIDLLRSPERQARIRAEMIPDSRRRFAWSAIAQAWEQEFASA